MIYDEPFYHIDSVCQWKRGLVTASHPHAFCAAEGGGSESVYEKNSSSSSTLNPQKNSSGLLNHLFNVFEKGHCFVAVHNPMVVR